MDDENDGRAMSRRVPMQVAPGAWRYALPVFALAVPAIALSPLGSLGAVLLGVAILLFHRDPDRTPPEKGILSPADGRVSVVREESGPDGGRERVRVGVFMNVTDVHVNRAPVSGKIGAVEHVPGGHWPAFSKDADRNERLHVDLGDTRVTLIAGTVARRIHTQVATGETIERGDRIGHVSFGSRADVLLPERFDVADVAVEPGETVRAGESIVAIDPEH